MGSGGRWFESSRPDQTSETAIELLHPDKPQPEMFLCELGVGSEHRGRGVATALMQRPVQLCHERGCGETFVLTDEDNAAGMAKYRRAGGKPESAGIMFTCDWRPEEEPRRQGWLWPPCRWSSEGDEGRRSRAARWRVRPPSRAPAYENARGQTGCPADDPALACPLA